MGRATGSVFLVFVALSIRPPTLSGTELIGLTAKSPDPASTPPDPASKGPLASVYARAAPAVVGLECISRDGKSVYRYFGTGVIINPYGLVLTSISVVPAAATQIQVYLRGGLSYAAHTVRTVPEMEFSLLRIAAGKDFPFLTLGDSDEARVGHIGLTLGNAFQSIRNDDQVTLASGLVSGRYTLRSTRSQARYVGPVLETTAAVNDGMDGGPLLNAHGEIIGLLSLNFSTNRWLGTAIPINVLKPLLGKYRKWFSDRHERAGGYIGVEVVETPGSAAPARPLRVERVDFNGPAARAGLRRGHILLTVNGEAIFTVAEFQMIHETTTPATPLRLRVSTLSVDPKFTVNVAPTPGVAGPAEMDITIKMWERF